MDTKLIQYIKGYLYETFSIDKIKDQRNKKFKRGIIMDINHVVYVNNGRERIRWEIFNHLKDIFNVDDIVIESAMEEYLTEEVTKRKKRPTKRKPSRIPR